MSRIVELIEWLNDCPELTNILSIAGTEESGNRIILPQGASPLVSHNESIDVYGEYHCDITPYPSYYEDFQINCYARYDPQDESDPADNTNILNYQQVENICYWIANKNISGELPIITGKKVVSVECNPHIPQVRYVNDVEGIIAYFVTLRIRYVNDHPQLQR